MNKKLVIAIDGYVATGKGTVAQIIAHDLWYTYLDTGAMYRAATLYAYRHNLLDSDEQAKTEMMSQIDLSFLYNPETSHDDIFLNGENVEKEIRQTSLSLRMKSIVTSPVVRAALVEKQKKFALQGGVVADGRDMGTVVFPDADLKIFLIADLEVRAERRYKQLLESHHTADLDLIRQDIKQRDTTDYLGPQAINVKAADAITIDTTHLTIEEVVQKIKSLL